MIILGSTVPETLPGSPGHHPRVRYEDRQAALDLPHDSAAGRVRLRHLVEGYATRSPAAPMPGRAERRPEARHGLRGDRLGVVRFLRRQPDRRQSVRQLRAGAGCAHRQANLAFSGRPARHVGPGFSRGAEPGDGDAQRQAGRGRRADHQDRLRLRARPQDGQAALPGEVSQGSRVEAGWREARRCSRTR